MDFKISDTNKGKKSLIYDGFIYRIEVFLHVWFENNGYTTIRARPARN